MEQYTKPPLSYADQVSLLQERGLTIHSTDTAVAFLQRVNYYRFSAYCIPFQNVRDVFAGGSSFEIIEGLYHLDERLRNDLLALLSPIEIFLRSRIAYELSHGWGAFSHYDTTIFRRDFNHDEWIVSLEAEVSRASETFIEHYKAKYAGFPRLPIWMACEIMSLGCLSRLYGGLLPDPQRLICSVFQVHHAVLRSWMHVITYLRNICAHHGRLWNRELSIRPQIPYKDTRWASLGLDNRQLFACIAILEWMCRKTSIPVSTVEQIHEDMGSISAIDSRFMGMMGVPTGCTIGMCWEGTV